jgi:hypothetical protein
VLRKIGAMSRAHIAIAAGTTIVAVGIWLWIAFPLQIVDHKSDSARVQLEMIATALHEFARQTGGFPREAEGLEVLVAGGYFKSNALVDPWGQRINYRCAQIDCSSVMVRSSGRNLLDDAGKGDDISVVVAP